MTNQRERERAYSPPDPKDIKAVLFDLDDTLRDTLGCCIKNHQTVAAAPPYNCSLSEETIYRWWGSPMEVLYHHFYNVPLIDPNNPDTIAKQAEAARLMGEETARNSIDIFPEATAVLGLLKERGVKIGIITASAQNLLDADSKVGEILNICDYIQPTSLGVPHKPNPHVFDLAFERFLTPAGILREHVWYIGDAPHKDGAAAYRAKLGGFLGVATGLFSIADHHANGFDAVASIAQAPEYLGIK